MEYRPKHPQPFSLSDALKFDPATITEGSVLTCYQIAAYRTIAHLPPCPTCSTPPAEITRLQNSLQHLRRTQDELRPHSDDPELSQALRENEAVMFVPPTSSIRDLKICARLQRITGRADQYAEHRVE